MTNLKDLMRIASDGDGAAEPADATETDLERARAAYDSRRRSRATWMTGAATLGAVAVIGTTVLVSQGDSTPESSPPTAQSSTPPQGGAAAELRLVSDETDSGPYTFGQVPDGWDLQAEGPASVVFTPPGGGVSGNPDDFVGKLVVMYDQNGLGNDTETADGRDYTVHSDSGYTTLSAATLAGQPEGVVRVQYPQSSGWSQDVLREFLFSVTVNEGAQPGLG